MSPQQLLFGLTAEHPCSYLPQQQERLVFTLPEQPLDTDLYQQLMDYNFRRTGDQLYRPYCLKCQACQACRVLVDQFKLSTGQRKLLKKAEKAKWHWKFCPPDTVDAYYPLYQQYISEIHADGVMYPPSEEQLASLLQCGWLNISVIEQYLGTELVGVILLDPMLDGYSAVYSFYKPHSELALGTLAILATLFHSQQQQLPFLYLGYFIADCTKMAYKAKFRPQQRLIAGKWQSFD
ncbi:MAG TPA: arginyltransferase [Rheinheimera sp.]|uniref:arginyltransferase n=1 Tax=Rheinheimera sp. TaxID=1869214 RepID=UPI000EC251EB|nr:arginyltransferase [Rheinheimera sp.]HCU66847.1 arginyltransferase [Rheinheimera sp.]